MKNLSLCWPKIYQNKSYPVHRVVRLKSPCRVQFFTPIEAASELVMSGISSLIQFYKLNNRFYTRILGGCVGQKTFLSPESDRA